MDRDILTSALFPSTLKKLIKIYSSASDSRSLFQALNKCSVKREILLINMKSQTLKPA